jgi:hypothetical protein
MALVGNMAGTARTESPAAVRGESGERGCQDADMAAALDSAAALHRVRLWTGMAGRAREARRVVGVGQRGGAAYRTEATTTSGRHGRNGVKVAEASDSAAWAWEMVWSGRPRGRDGGT